ncbi:Flagellar hook-length control protein FliK [Caulifigura coniformis]|uniref:Flagellar hook-length control protein FliK n=1 Tax=Caulifigura coniformis TaxID=2527983 RepID=A0A517SJB1_9PLAN|nr:flagellar hook-length control protein FliK [Caulifigura coniformis]QDT56214.1 Flagellar hook-length control protein FliK [Caulifigura coniformis]
MNTSLLSFLSAAPPPEPTSQPRPAKSEQVAPGELDELESSQPDSAGDSDKMDAFAEMLAAMMSVSTPLAESPGETTGSTVVDSATALSTDVPRDGAGSPLFTSSFTTTTAADSNSAVMTVTTTEVAPTADTTAMSTSETTSDLAGVPSDATAAAELAGLGVETLETAPVAEESPVVVDVLTTEDERLTLEAPEAVADEPARPEVPVVAVRESAAAQTTTDDRPVSTELAVETEGLDEPAPSEGPTLEKPEGQHSHPILKEAIPESPVADVDVTPAEPVMPEAPVAESEVHPVAGEPPVVQASDLESANPLEETQQVESASGSDRATAAPKSERATTAAPNRPVTASPEVGGASEPVLPDVLAPVEQTSGVALQNDAARGHKVHQDSRDDEFAAMAAMDGEAVPATAGPMVEGAVGRPASIATISSGDAAASAAPVNVTQQVMQALAAYEADLPQNGARSFEMLLDPPELGRLLVQMSRTSKGVDVRISAENESVRSMLETSGAELQQSLQLSGFDLGQFSGSNSGGAFAGGEEWVSAPTLQSFATGAGVVRTTPKSVTANSAINVVV